MYHKNVTSKFDMLENLHFLFSKAAPKYTVEKHDKSNILNINGNIKIYVTKAGLLLEIINKNCVDSVPLFGTSMYNTLISVVAIVTSKNSEYRCEELLCDMTVVLFKELYPTHYDYLFTSEICQPYITSEKLELFLSYNPCSGNKEHLKKYNKEQRKQVKKILRSISGGNGCVSVCFGNDSSVSISVPLLLKNATILIHTLNYIISQLKELERILDEDNDCKS